MFEQIRSILSESPWLIGLATIVFFTLKGLLWIVVPVILYRCKRWLLRSESLAIRKP